MISVATSAFQIVVGKRCREMKFLASVGGKVQAFSRADVSDQGCRSRSRCGLEDVLTFSILLFSQGSSFWEKVSVLDSETQANPVRSALSR